ncbi:MAG: biopolymer transporter ExbD [Labilithrix sp.]|nr:biopolymer transporter ExbD [Labilithrix sp.]
MAIAIRAASKRQHSAPDINVTPLVDVVLVLLIIFMVIAPALEHGERVELPAILQPDKNQKSKLDPITVTVAQSGTIYLEKTPMPADALPAHLASIHAHEPDRRVVLKGDGSVGYQKVRDVFAIVQNAGFSGVSLQVSQRGGSNDEQPDNEEKPAEN